MRKLLILFSAFAVFAILSCSNNIDDLPCLSCGESACLIYSGGSYQCQFMNLPGKCAGEFYRKDTTCGGYWWVPSKGNDIANYKTVQIGEQMWMAENLNYHVQGSRCYDNDPANCDKYGRVYDWPTAMALPYCRFSLCSSQVGAKHQGICPNGWHIPSNADWDKLKATIGNGEDTYEFSALGDGSVWWSAIWWSASEYDDYEAYCYNGDKLHYRRKHNDYSYVRCLQD